MKKIQYDEHNGRVRARKTVVCIDGSKQRIEAYGGTKTEAKAVLEEKVEELNKIIRYGERKKDGSITLEEAVWDKIIERKNAYDRAKKRKKLRDTSSKRDEDVYRALILPHPIAKKKLNQIFLPELEEYYRWLGTAQYDKCSVKDPEKHVSNMKHYSSSTLNRVLRLVKIVIDEYYLHSEYKTPTEILVPFVVVQEKKTENDFLIGEEFKRALCYFAEVRDHAKYELDPVYADFFSVALLTALRPGELRGLKKRDWTSEKSELQIMRTGTYEDGRTKTEGSRENMIVVQAVAEILNRRCADIKADDYIFQNTKGKTLSASDTNRKLKKWLAEIGIKKDLHPHSLRGSAGTYLVDSGVDLETVSDILRHTSSNTTEKFYIARTEKRKQMNAEKMRTAYDKLGI